MMRIKRFLIKLNHWEYWPFHWVYGPLYFYWFWLCLRAQSFFFFNTSNPGIRHGGFLMESKKEIYDLLPPEVYPATILCADHSSLEDIGAALQKNNMDFPLIAKPDIGLRGMGVALLETFEALCLYHSRSKVDYLLQAYITYPQEAGIFYYRMPGENHGHITGIVGKEFLTVKGDGSSTVQELLQRVDRFALQLQNLQLLYGDELQDILAQDEERLLVPFGNHCRGAKFIDITHLATPSLTKVIDNICRNVDGFYFGRMDVKYNNWEDFCNGENFSIIELNGAGSEPAHIYDPTHSLFFGWKEIIRHWKILFEISKRSKSQHQLEYMTLKEGIRMFKDNARHLKMLSRAI